MTINTTIASLSQTAALNGPDGSADLPSTLDDAIRYHGAFIAQLRDGAGYGAGAVVAALGYTPVQQGGGGGQGTNKVYIGYGSGNLRLQVDSTDFGAVWPHGISGNAATATNASNATFASTAAVATNANAVNGQSFSWSNPTNTPTYVWAANTNGSAFLAAPGGMSVNYASSSNTANLATNANNAYACSGNSATASNASAVNGISGWTYTNSATNPAYIWCTDGAGTYQHLTQPGNLSVNYANGAGYATNAGNATYADNAGNAYSCSGNAATCTTASNSNALQGLGPNDFCRRGTGNNYSAVWDGGNGYVYWTIDGSAQYAYTHWTKVQGRPSDLGSFSNGPGYVSNGGSAVQNLRNNGTSQLICNLGSGDTFWATTFISDRRVKTDIALTERDSLAEFAALEYVQYRIDETVQPGADTRLHTVGFIAQEAQAVNPSWVVDDPALSEYLHVNDPEILLSAMHALKQANDRIVALEAAVASLLAKG